MCRFRTVLLCVRLVVVVSIALLLDFFELTGYTRFSSLQL